MCKAGSLSAGVEESPVCVYGGHNGCGVRGYLRRLGYETLNSDTQNCLSVFKLAPRHQHRSRTPGYPLRPSPLARNSRLHRTGDARRLPRPARWNDIRQSARDEAERIGLYARSRWKATRRRTPRNCHQLQTATDVSRAHFPSRQAYFFALNSRFRQGTNT
jgi:hypothetical protein